MASFSIFTNNWANELKGGEDVLADRIRAFAYRTYVEPARERGTHEITIRTGDVHRAMKLENRNPAVCSALGAKAFASEYGLVLLRRKGPKHGANVFLTYQV